MINQMIKVWGGTAEAAGTRSIFELLSRFRIYFLMFWLNANVIFNIGKFNSKSIMGELV